MSKRQSKRSQPSRYEFLDAPEPKRGRSSRGRQSNRRPPSHNTPPQRGCFGKMVTIMLYIVSFGLLFGVIGGIGGYFYLRSELSDAIAKLTTYNTAAGGTPRFYDRNGRLLLELNTVESRKALQFEDIPDSLIAATIAVEDDTYWENWGIDPAAIGAAVVYNFQQSGRPVGASTITQQIVRHIAFSYEERTTASYQRKIKEIFLAVVLTQERSKEEILTLYLNEIYYGNRAYGIEAAAQTYFGKSAIDLELAESAFLAGLPQAPAVWDPYTNFDAAKARQEFILDLMVEDGSISELDAVVHKEIELVLKPLFGDETASGNDSPLFAPHFVLYVQNELERRFGPNALYEQGWQVTTSLDLDIQQLTEQELRRHVAEWGPSHDMFNGAVVVMKPGTNEILAMVGSIDYFNEVVDGQVNMALAPRQPGSTFKPITYAAAMELGWSTTDVLWDVPIQLEIGNDEMMRPTNYDNRFHGPMLLRDSLANSYNIPPLQLARDVGLSQIINIGRRMGITSLNQDPNFYGLSLTLGGGEVPLIEMTHAYSTLANYGQFSQISPIIRIEDSNGNLVFDGVRDRLPPSQVISAGNAYILTDILDDDRARTPAMGYGSALEMPFPAAAKTGTTNDFRDNLTIGYTPGLVVGVWLGNSDGRPMKNTSGLTGAAPLWSRIIRGVYANEAMMQALWVNDEPPPTEFVRPSVVVDKTVCLPQGTGGSSCTASRTELVVEGAAVRGVGRFGYVPDITSNPGAWTLTTLPMPVEAAQAIHQPPLNDGTKPPLTSICATNRAYEGSVTRVLIPPPPFYADEVRARVWAAQTGWISRMAPPSACSASVIQGKSVVQSQSSSNQSSSSSSTNNGVVTSAGGGNAVVIPQNTGGGAVISSPASGAVLSGVVSIVGTASSADMNYYKLEIGNGSNPDSWTTFGNTHTTPVNNGVLETLQADALPAGTYTIRLVIVNNDGNFGAIYTVPVTIQ